MAWDPSRRVPWRRLIREGAIFLAIGVILFALFFKNSRAASYAGLVIGMFIFIGVSAVLAKFGYTRQTMKEQRSSQAARSSSDRRSSKSASKSASASADRVALRSKPAPTRRTSTGPSQRPNRKRH